MSEYTLKGYDRTDLRKGVTKQLRREGKIPAVIYGKNKTKAIAVEAKEFNTKFHHISENTLITITIGRKKHEVLIKDYQENLLKNYLVHLDFFEVEKGKLLRTHIPLTITGSAKGVKEGGILQVSLHEIEVECTPQDIPDHFTVDVTNLEVGESIHIDTLKVPEGVRLLVDDDMTIVSVTAPKVEVEEHGEEEAEEPEVIGEDKESEESESE